MARQIDRAARQARDATASEMRRAQVRFDNAAYRIEQLAGTVAAVREQRRRLLWATGSGLFAGMLLWSFLPGVVLRAMPQSWHMPESMAAHIIGEPTLWEAGSRLMHADSPQTWQAIVAATDMRRDNRDVIAACERKATAGRRSVQCAVRVEPPENGD